MSLAYGELFSKWEIGLTKNLIKQYKNKWRCLNRDSLEDLMQECLLHWYYTRKKYDPDREKDEKTFMRRVIKNKLIDVVKDREREKRKPYFHSISLESLPKIIEDKISVDPSDKIIESEFIEKFNKAYQKLTPRQKELFHLLSEEKLSLKEISKFLGINRSTVYDEIERMKKLFTAEGLNEYLK